MILGINGPGSRSGSRSYGVVFSGTFLGPLGKETKTTPVPATSPAVSLSPTLIPPLHADSPVIVVEGNGRKRVRDVPVEIQTISKKRYIKPGNDVIFRHHLPVRCTSNYGLTVGVFEVLKWWYRSS